MATQLRGDKCVAEYGILPYNGYSTQGYTDIAGGGIIQVRRTLYTTPATFGHSTDQLVQLPGLSVSITPKSSSNRILIYIRFNGEIQNSHNALFHVLRNGSTLTTPTVAPSNRNYGLIPPGESYAANGGNFGTTPCTADYWWMDAPGTTSSVTYAAGCRFSYSQGTECINRTRDDVNGTARERMSSEIVVMEVTG